MTVFFIHDGTWGIGWGFPFFVFGSCLIGEAIFPIVVIRKQPAERTDNSK